MEMVCIICPNSCRMEVINDTGNITVSGNLCKRGIEFAHNELINPMRSLTTTVRTTSNQMPMLPVRTDGEIPKDKLLEAMEFLKTFVQDSPVRCGDIIIENLVGTNCSLIATCSLIYERS